MGAAFIVYTAWPINFGDGSVSSWNFGFDLMTIKKRVISYAKLMRLDKPIGIFLLLWPMLWGLWFAAKGIPDMMILGIFIMGTVLMRSAGCVVNDYADQEIDPHVERTKSRPLVTGTVTAKEALLLAAGLSFCAFLLILR
jgi:4-hydroxybenzoate polyprenyltransferase